MLLNEGGGGEYLHGLEDVWVHGRRGQQGCGVLIFVRSDAEVCFYFAVAAEIAE